MHMPSPGVCPGAWTQHRSSPCRHGHMAFRMGPQRGCPTSVVGLDAVAHAGSRLDFGLSHVTLGEALYIASPSLQNLCPLPH